MPWGRVTIAAAIAAGAAFALVPAAAALANGIVVATSGPSAGKYPVGRKLADNESIVLAPGDTLTVLDGRGTRVLKGAGTYTLSQQAGPSKSGAFALLTRERAAQRMRTGAVRGDVTGPVTRPNLWYVDVSGSGATCVPKSDEIRLWRPTSQGDATYTIKPAGGSAATQVVFHDGEMLSPWDGKALPVADGSSFVISQPGAAERTVTFKMLDAVPSEPDALADELISHGCTAQLEVLSQAMRVDTE
jgi:hypothetical protein